MQLSNSLHRPDKYSSSIRYVSLFCQCCMKTPKILILKFLGAPVKHILHNRVYGRKQFIATLLLLSFDRTTFLFGQGLLIENSEQREKELSIQCTLSLLSEPPINSAHLYQKKGKPQTTKTPLMTGRRLLYLTCTSLGNCREYIKGNLSKQLLDFDVIIKKV